MTTRRTLRVLIAAILLGSSLLLTILALSGFGLVDISFFDGQSAVIESRRRLWPIALLILLAAITTVVLWYLDRRAGGVSRSELEGERRHRRAAEKLGSELREKVSDLRSHSPSFSASDDVSNLILSLALELLDADRGAILEARGGEARVLTSAVGFEGDPRSSQIVSRFATEALRRDEIVHEQGEPVSSLDDGVDAEIRNIVAIPIFLRDELNGVVVCANSARPGEHDEEVLLALGDQAGAVLENGKLEGQMREAHLETVRMLVEAIRAKDPHLGGHSEEVSRYVGRVAARLGFDQARRERLLFASLLHDIGKIGISERILLKPGRLSPEEFGMIEQHPGIGSRLVERVPSLSELSGFILHHHERYDGGGYPGGLEGDGIPLESRVIGVADAFSAMTSDRPYRGRLSLAEACAELERCSGSQFDPEVVEAFVDEVRQHPPAGPLDSSPVVADEGPLRSSAELLGDPLELTDSLTLLYTHRYFHEHVAELARAARHPDDFHVLFVRLGGLGRINAAQGYAAGDRAVQAAARVVEDAAVRCGATAARHGGRSFALVIAGAEPGVAETAAAEIAAHAPSELALELASAAWAPGMLGDDVIAAARARLPGSEPALV